MKLNAVGIHVFAGLFTEGVKKHFNIPAVINDGYGDEIHLANHEKSALFPTNKFNAGNYENIDFVYSQPPCAPWSIAGNKKGLNDPRINMTTNASLIASKLCPQVFVLESVVRAFTKGRKFYNELGELWKSNGYKITHILINGIFTGTPQIRKRYLFVAHKNNLILPKFTEVKNVNRILKNIIPGGYNICVPSLELTLKKIGYSDIKEGDNLFKWFTKINKNPKYKPNGHMIGRPARSSVRLHGEKPAPVFVGDYSWLHPTEERPITMNELKGLCSLRQDYKLLNYSRPAAQVFLGRSVMPGTGAWIADMAKQTIIKNSNVHHLDVLDLRNGEYQPFLI